jgi:hypothetical protein
MGLVLRYNELLHWCVNVQQQTFRDVALALLMHTTFDERVLAGNACRIRTYIVHHEKGKKTEGICFLKQLPGSRKIREWMGSHPHQHGRHHSQTWTFIGKP